MSWEGLNPPYRTIVADPPWDHSDGTGATLRPISRMPVVDLADRNSHLYLWTTNRYLRDAYNIAEAWGFRPTKPLVWCKEPMGFMGAPYVSSAEFVLYCRRGSLKAQDRVDRQWWVWARSAHSQKPAAFYDIVERVSPGPYVELFARQPRLGWDHWGHGFEGAA